MSEIIRDGLTKANLVVSISASEIRTTVESQLKKNAGRFKVAGFRPGKAPLSVLYTQYGEGYKSQAIDEAVKKSVAEKADAEKLSIVGTVMYETQKDESTEDALVFKAHFEVLPEVEFEDFAKIKVAQYSSVIEDKDVDNTILTMRKQRGTFSPAKTKAAKVAKDDRITFDMVGKIDGEVFEGGDVKDQALIVGQKGIMAELNDNLIGLKVGEEKSFDITYPENYAKKEIAGKTATTTVVVSKIEKPQTPELNEEFIKSFGVEGDLEKFKTEVRRNMQQRLNETIDEANQTILYKEVVKQADPAVPNAVLQMQYNFYKERVKQYIENSKQKWNDEFFNPEDFKEQATFSAQLFVILSVYGKKFDLQPKSEDVKAHIDALASTYEKPEQVTNWYYSDMNRLQEVYDICLRKNIANYVLEKAKVENKTANVDEVLSGKFAEELEA